MSAVPTTSTPQKHRQPGNGHDEDPRPVVVLSGNSLLLDGVASSLATAQLPNLVQLDISGPDLEMRLKSLHPRLILFELNCSFTECLFHILLEQPGALLLGLDCDACQALLLSGSRHVTPTISDLCRLIGQEVGQEDFSGPPSASPPGSG
jgi:hypothetical protein